MKKVLASTLALLIGTSAAYAQMPPLADIDADASGTIALAELQAVWPELSQEQFTSLDADGSGDLDAMEFQVLVDAMAGGAPAAPSPAETLSAPEPVPGPAPIPSP